MKNKAVIDTIKDNARELINATETGWTGEGWALAVIKNTAIIESLCDMLTTARSSLTDATTYNDSVQGWIDAVKAQAQALYTAQVADNEPAIYRAAYTLESLLDSYSRITDNY